MHLQFLRRMGIEEEVVDDRPRGIPGKSTITSRLSPPVVIRVGDAASAQALGQSMQAPVQMRRTPASTAPRPPAATEPVDDPFALHLTSAPKTPPPPEPAAEPPPPRMGEREAPTAGAAELTKVFADVRGWAARAVPPNQLDGSPKPDGDVDGKQAPDAEAKPENDEDKERDAKPENEGETAFDTTSDAKADDSPEAGAKPVQKQGYGADHGPDHSPDDVHAIAARGASGGSHTLPFLDRIQAAFGRHDVRSIRAHTGSAARAANQQMESHAYAHGDDVVFGHEPDLFTAAHEAAHVVQQRRGVSLSGGVGAEGDEYERHADAVAEAVVRGESAERLLDQVAGGSSSGGARTGVQHKKPPPPPASLANFRVKPEFMGGEPLTGLAYYRDLYFSAAETSYDVLSLEDNLKAVDAVWGPLMSAYDSGCAQVAQALAKALSEKGTVLDGQARQDFQRLTDNMAIVKGQCAIIRGITNKTDGMTKILDGVQDELEAAELAIKNAESEQERRRLEKELQEQKEIAGQFAASINLVLNTLVKTFSGKPVQAAEAAVGTANKALIEAICDNVIVDPRLERKMAGLKRWMDALAGSIRALSKSAATDKLAGVTQFINGLRDEHAGANTLLAQGLRACGQEIDDLKNLKGKENSHIAAVFAAIDAYVTSVGPKGEAVRQALDNVRLPPKDPHDTKSGLVPSDPRRAVKPPNIPYIIEMINLARAEVKGDWQRAWANSYEPDDPRQQVLDQKMAAWEAEASGIAAWLAQVEQWQPEKEDAPAPIDHAAVEEDLTYKRTFISGQHLAKKDEAIRIIESEILPRRIP